MSEINWITMPPADRYVMAWGAIMPDGSHLVMTHTTHPLLADKSWMVTFQEPGSTEVVDLGEHAERRFAEDACVRYLAKRRMQ